MASPALAQAQSNGAEASQNVALTPLGGPGARAAPNRLLQEAVEAGGFSVVLAAIELAQ
jgi:hypothetical protein